MYSIPVQTLMNGRRSRTELAMSQVSGDPDGNEASPSRSALIRELFFGKVEYSYYTEGGLSLFKKCLIYLSNSRYLNTMNVMKAIEGLGKVHYAPLKRNRLVSISVASGYQRAETLTWFSAEATTGKLGHINKFPKGPQVKAFRIASVSVHTEYIAANDLSQCAAETAEKHVRLRWKIEQLHRELRQTMGLGACQCRKHRAQRNPTACCLWVWVFLKRAAQATGQTLYQLKASLLQDYTRKQLQNPTISPNIA